MSVSNLSIRAAVLSLRHGGFQRFGVVHAAMPAIQPLLNVGSRTEAGSGNEHNSRLTDPIWECVATKG